MEPGGAVPGTGGVEADFYVLGAGGEEERLRTACRLAEKAWRSGYRVHLRAADGRQAEALDALLWTFRQDSFVPHGLVSTEPDAPVTVGMGDLPDTPSGAPLLVINLADELPAEPPCPGLRLAEVVGVTGEDREEGRRRWRGYRGRGWTLRSHSL